MNEFPFALVALHLKKFLKLDLKIVHQPSILLMTDSHAYKSAQVRKELVVVVLCLGTGDEVIDERLGVAPSTG